MFKEEWRIAISILFAFLVGGVCAEGLEPPKVNMIDPFGVNLATGQVTASVDTVAIGGEELGLKHSISGHTNSFSFRGWKGYNDAFHGEVRYAELGRNLAVDGKTYSNFYVMRAFGPAGTADFKIYVNGVLQNGVSTSVKSGFSYKALGDPRHTLKIIDDHYVWTQPSGVRYHFKRDVYKNARSLGTLVEIEQPNGFRIYISPGNGAYTNTGYQIKYGYLPDTRAVPSSVKNTYRKGLSPNSSAWADRNPAFYTAINTTVEWCSLNKNDRCDHLVEEWPTANITWPAGMPKAFYIGENDLEVTGPEGEITRLRFKAYDLKARNPGDPNDGEIIVRAPYEWSPRLVEVYPPGASEPVFTYSYKNRYEVASTASGGSGLGFSLVQIYWWLDSAVGDITRPDGQGGSATYDIEMRVGSWNTEFKNRASVNGLSYWAIVRSLNNYPGTIREASIPKVGTFNYPATTTNPFDNRPVTGSLVEGPNLTYKYDTNRNLKKLIKNEGQSLSVTTEASFTASCSGGNSHKYCYKADWVKDARGKVTRFKYHEESGLVKSITYPKDAHGVAAQNRYFYKQYRARYINPLTGVSEVGEPIWMLWKERYCRTGNASGDGCQKANDEIVIEYDYGSSGEMNNLNLRMKKVIGAGGAELVSCYEYNYFGQLIGEVKPRQNRTTCY